MMPYTYAKVEELEGHALVGSHQCVALVQIYAGAPLTAGWRQGDVVMGDRILHSGTAIATFPGGRYPNNSHGNHAALFLRQAPGGIYVMDQWANKKDGKISSRFIKAQGKDKKGNFKFPSDNADAFFVIN